MYPAAGDHVSAFLRVVGLDLGRVSSCCAYGNIYPGVAHGSQVRIQRIPCNFGPGCLLQNRLWVACCRLHVHETQTAGQRSKDRMTKTRGVCLRSSCAHTRAPKLNVRTLLPPHKSSHTRGSRLTWSVAPVSPWREAGWSDPGCATCVLLSPRALTSFGIRLAQIFQQPKSTYLCVSVLLSLVALNLEGKPRKGWVR